MSETIQTLLLAALLMALTAVLVYLAERKTRFGRLPERPRQLIIGLLHF